LHESLLLLPRLLLLLLRAHLMPRSHALLGALQPLLCLPPIQPCILASRAQIVKAPCAVVVLGHRCLAAYGDPVPRPHLNERDLRRFPFC